MKLQRFLRPRRAAARVLPGVAAVATVFAGCGGDDDGTGPDVPVVAAVEVAPALDTLSALEVAVELAATARDGDGGAIADVDVSWASSDAEVVSVDSTGVATSVSDGSATIEAAVDGVTGSATLVVRQTPVAVTVSPRADTLAALGATVRLEAAVEDANGHPVEDAAVEWMSLVDSIAAVDAVGRVEALAAGMARVEAVAGEVADTAVVFIEQVAGSVEVTPAADTLRDGETMDLAAAVADSNGVAMPDAAVEWASGDTAAATVEATGPRTARITAERAGVVPVTAAAGPASGSAEVKVLGHIAFARYTGSSYDILIMYEDGVGQTNLTNSAAGDLGPPVWSPDGARLAFRSFRDDSDYEIVVVNADGTGQMPLTDNTARDEQPAWSPDAGRVAFVSDRDGNDEIYVVNADGTGEMRLTENAGNDTQPAWSPDGTEIAFRRSQDAGIYVMNPDGTGQTRLTTTDGYDPAWSPDGERIAFTSWRDGNADIHVMDADGSVRTPLTADTASDTDPAWSPDGTRIAFQSDRDGDPEIYVVNADGSGLTNVSNHGTDDYFPVWSPDGSRIAFRSDRAGGSREIYAVDPDGTNPVNLTDDLALDTNPAWRPFPRP